MTTTEKLLKELNDKKGLSYPDIDYSYFADITGNGVYRPKVYTIINKNGGVAYSHTLNGSTPRKRCDAIRAAIGYLDYIRYEDDAGDFVIDGSIEHNHDDVIRGLKAWLESNPHSRFKL